MTTTTIATEGTVPARYRVGQHVRLVHEQRAWNANHAPGERPAQTWHTSDLSWLIEHVA